jgi:cyclopropane fatty-acyl-phospholipid synthase-like methyltransferase
MKKVVLLSLLTLLIVACGEGREDSVKMHDHHEMDEHHKGEHHHGDANEYMHSSEFDELVERFESNERDEYQEPDKVIDFLDGIEGLTIMDLGAGTGYFSFKFVEAGANVIAADVNDQFQEFIKKKCDSLGISNAQLALRKVEYDDPLLSDGEVDKVVIVNTYHHIENRGSYFTKVKHGLKDLGELVVIDFIKKDIPYGPPVKMKLSAAEVVKELKEAGYREVEVNDTLLKYQYIIRAKLVRTDPGCSG